MVHTKHFACICVCLINLILVQNSLRLQKHFQVVVVDINHVIWSASTTINGFLVGVLTVHCILVNFLAVVVVQRGQFPWLSKKCTCLGTPSTSSRTTSKTGSSCFLISSDFCFLGSGGEMEIFWILSLFGQVLLNSSIFWELPVYLHLHLLPL